MNGRIAIPAVACVSFVFFVASVHAEQWLQYRFAKDPYPATGVYTSSQSVDVTSDRPRDVALPAFTGNPIFGRWATPMVQAGRRLIALDQSKKGGPHDVLYIDADGDGHLAGETPVSAWPAERESDPEGYEYSTFGPVKVLLKGDDGLIAYHLVVSYYSYKDRTRISVRSVGWYEGKVKVGDRECACRLFDYNGNGAFNDVSSKTREADLLSLDVKGDGKFEPFFLGKYLQPASGGPYYVLTVARDGACISVSPANDVRLGTVSLPKDTGLAELVGENGHFRRRVQDGPVQVPAGVYTVKHIDYARKDDRGVRWELVSYDFPPAFSFEVKPGETTTLSVGEPIVSTLTVQKSGSAFYFEQSLKGANGEYVQIHRDGNQAPAPQVRIRNADGSYDRLSTLEYG